MLQGKSVIPQQDALLGCTLHDGEYLVRRVLEYGNECKTYMGIHTTLHIPFALKQSRADSPLPETVIAELDAALRERSPAQQCERTARELYFPSSGGELTDRFLREALLLTRLHHAAIPTLYDYFFEDGYWYLVTDYIPGTTLSAYLRHHAPLPPLEALHYAMQLCDVLDYLHRQEPPIIFRDLQPSNIVLTPGGTLMLVNFGMARYFKKGQYSDTQDLRVPGYVAPEQYQGEGQSDGRSDLFSLGVLLHEMIGGERLSPASLLLDAPRQIHADISVALQAFINLATRSQPMYRFQNAQTLYLALDRISTLEERRAYQRYVQKLRQIEQKDAEQMAFPMASIPATEQGWKEPQEEASDEEPVLPGLEERYLRRESLYLARVERRGQRRVSAQLPANEPAQKSEAKEPEPERRLSTDSLLLRRIGHTQHNMRTLLLLCFVLTIMLTCILLVVFLSLQEQP
ncbi:serine/threonine protein kinase [Thermosporothrix hazakensis]|jgi:serine/threonine protein kinase|uniref:non-specific serine/threonine protein kinase n=1 Tax=Thermosporothrix hazakensis TaxID=644383 RepID=A0A326TYS0_THEHA|nr:serine/threonine-protein kinase [Thermosporothrix hazakensis]PZW20798.1 serine/threonine protein kinase [Thermosporothrix hazakensis]GCE47547.1 hypothetical protein KTH_24160 [Thermosporothrix hazakensis]